PTPEGDVPEDSGLSQDLNDQAHCPPNRYVVVTSNSEHGDVNIDGSPKAKSPSPHVEVKIKNAKGVAVEFADRAGTSSIPGNNAKTFAFVLDDESPTDEFYESKTIDSATAHNAYVPE
ncbi:hypothetical protein Tco_0358078, partial [Tanacetum coccineum]